MQRFSSIFSPLLQLFPRIESELAGNSRLNTADIPYSGHNSGQIFDLIRIFQIESKLYDTEVLSRICH
jgi:hypothetical protein